MTLKLMDTVNFPKKQVGFVTDIDNDKITVFIVKEQKEEK